MSVLWEFIGWGSAVVLVGAYALVATHRLEARGVRYHALNLIAALGLAAYSAVKMAWPQVALNAFWAAIAVVGVILAVGAARGITNARVEPDPEPGVEPVREG